MPDINSFLFNGGDETPDKICRNIISYFGHRSWKRVFSKMSQTAFCESLTCEISLIDALQPPYQVKEIKENIKGANFSPTHRLDIIHRRTPNVVPVADELKLLSFMFGYYEGDAIYLARHTTPTYWRRNGQLYISSELENWIAHFPSEEFSRLLGVHFEFERMPSCFG